MQAIRKRKPKPIEVTFPTAASPRQALMDFYAYLEDNPDIKPDSIIFKSFHLPGVRADKWKVRFREKK